MQTVTLDEFKGMAGTELGASDWFEINQERINAFAGCTDDHQFIHVDPAAAKETPFGTTIAHGFLSLSLMASHGPAESPKLEGAVMTINYGLNRVRFITPVTVDSRVRIHTKILSVVEKSPGNVLVSFEKKMEIEGIEKPAYIAESLAMVVTSPQ